MAPSDPRCTPRPTLASKLSVSVGVELEEPKLRLVTDSPVEPEEGTAKFELFRAWNDWLMPKVRGTFCPPSCAQSAEAEISKAAELPARRGRRIGLVIRAYSNRRVGGTTKTSPCATVPVTAFGSPSTMA